MRFRWYEDFGLASEQFLGSVDLPAADWARMGVILILGSLPFCAMGLAIGYFAGPNSAPAIVNLL